MNPFSRTVFDEKELRKKKDAELLELSLKHPWMFEMLVDKYQGRFLKKARSILGVHEDAEDAVQETFVRIYRHAERFHEEEGASFSSWAYKVLTNTCFTLYQKKKRRAALNPSMEHALCDREVDVPAARFETLDRYDVASVLERMPQTLRNVLEKHFLLGVPQKDIAHEEGVPVGTIKARVHRAKAEFRKLHI